MPRDKDIIKSRENNCDSMILEDPSTLKRHIKASEDIVISKKIKISPDSRKSDVCEMETCTDVIDGPSEDKSCANGISTMLVQEVRVPETVKEMNNETDQKCNWDKVNDVLPFSDINLANDSSPDSSKGVNSAPSKYKRNHTSRDYKRRNHKHSTHESQKAKYPVPPVESQQQKSWAPENYQFKFMAPIKISEMYSSKEDTYKLEPIFVGHQLVGDSQLLRFAQCILGIPRKFDHKGRGWLGLCVSGQKISDLHERVLSGLVPIGEKLIVMIGTNDILQASTSSYMITSLQALLKTLFKSARKLVLLTLPPVPKLSYLEEHWLRLNTYNNFILSIKGIFPDNELEVVDISSMFYESTFKKCYLSLFEMWYESAIRRPDLIHVNEKGMKLIRNELLKKL